MFGGKLMIKKLKNINKKRIFIILGIIAIVLIFIIIFLRINKNIVKLNEEARTEAESDEINLKIDIKESTTDNYKCLLTFSSNNEVNNIKQIEYPEEEGKDKYIVNIANENGKEKVESLLQLYNRKSKSFQITNAIGDVSVRAGCLLPVILDLGVAKVQSMMLVESCKHVFRENENFMNLTLRGGDFV